MDANTNVNAKVARYTAVWRWHFYAGLFAAPFVLMLAITGAIYLFNDELFDLQYPELRFAESTSANVQTSQLIAAAQQAFPNAAVARYEAPATAGRTASVALRDGAGTEHRVFVDPSNGRVLGSFVYERTLVGLVDRLHGSLLLGAFGDAMVELAACWTAVLVATGLYLWWPRGRERIDGVLRPRLRAKGRTFWRDLHKVTGLYASLLILFLVLSGLPWAGIWGGKILQPISNALGVGYPLYRYVSPQPSVTVGESLGDVPWTLQQAPMPQSSPAVDEPHAMHAGHSESTQSDTPPSSTHRQSIGIDAAVRILAEHGMTQGFRLSLPKGGSGVYSAMTFPDRPEDQRSIHLDQRTGEVLADIGYAEYGSVAKIVETGISLHLGNYFGRANQLLMLATCLAIVLLVVSGITMWWRRRPAGGLGAPRTPAPLKLRNAVLIVLALCAWLPLAAASLVAVLGIDFLWSVSRRARATQAH